MTDTKTDPEEALREAAEEAADWIDTAASNETTEAEAIVSRLRAALAQAAPPPEEWRYDEQASTVASREAAPPSGLRRRWDDDADGIEWEQRGK